MIRRVCALLGVAAVLVATAHTTANARDVSDPTPALHTTRDGVFSVAQAEAGAALYKQHCILCHDKKYFRPILKARAGQSLELLFDIMATTMPESNPGVLYDSEYVELIAYILKLSRAPAGEVPLGGVEHSLDAIVIAN